MTFRKPCPQCGKPPADDAPAGLCAACLLQVGLDERPTAGAGPGRTAPTPAELEGLFPDLEILEYIGGGGMGLVYRARQLRLDRMVAVKILSPDLADDASFSQRFAREARALAQLSHPNIVAVHDFGETGGMFYLVMELVEGTSLRRVMESGTLEPAQALAIVPKLCEALQYAHDRGVVHRDIKPENVLLTEDGQIKVADFGLAKTLAQSHQSTVTAGVLGTPAYMAPEQIEKPHTVDHRADIYSLGVVFYEMLTGELPLGRFAPPSKKVAVDVRLDEVVLKTLEKERELRYQRAADLRTDVDGVAASPRPPAPPSREPAEPSTAPSPTAPAAAAPPPRKSRLARTALWLSIAGAALPLPMWALLAAMVPGRPILVSPGGMGISIFLLASLVGFVAAALGLTGIGMGVGALVSIVRSNGRLVGIPSAVVAIVIPLVAWIPGMVLFFGVPRLVL